MKYFLVLLFLHCCFFTTAQQVTWTQKFDFTQIDWSISLVEVSDGYVIMSGCMYVEGNPTPPILIKVDKNGELIWTCNPEPLVYFSDFPIIPHRCKVAPDSTILVCGRIAITDSTGAVFVLKVNQQGEIIWNKLYKEYIRYYETYWTEQIVTWPNGDFLVTGVYYNKPNGPDSMFLLKCNAAGDLIRETKINYPPVVYAGYEGGDSGNPVILPDGDIFFGFFTRWNTRYHVILNRLDSTLQVQWQKEATVIGRSYELARADDGNILMFVEGGYNNYPWGTDPIVQKLTPDGDSIWTYSPPGINSQLGHDMSILNNTNVVYTSSPDDSERLVCISDEGKFLWSKKFSPPVERPDDRLRWERVMGTSDGGILIAGYYRKYPDTVTENLDFDVFLVKLDSTGCLESDCPDDVVLTQAKEPFDILDRPVLFTLRTNLLYSGKPLEVQLTEGIGDAVLQLFDAAGRLVAEQQVRVENQATFSTRELSPGPYFLVMKTGTGAVQTQRLFITF